MMNIIFLLLSVLHQSISFTNHQTTSVVGFHLSYFFYKIYVKNLPVYNCV